MFAVVRYVRSFCSINQNNSFAFSFHFFSCSDVILITAYDHSNIEIIFEGMDQEIG